MTDYQGWQLVLEGWSFGFGWGVLVILTTYGGTALVRLAQSATSV